MENERPAANNPTEIHKAEMKITLVISTYNWPEALRLSLLSARIQTRIPDEIIIADDGSGRATEKLINSFKNRFPCPLIHAWQEDKGFRLAESRNNALRMATGDYVIFIDGDIIMERHFIADHERMAEKGFFVMGSRSKLSKQTTERLLCRHRVDLHWYSKGVRRRYNTMYLPFLAFYTEKLYRNRRDKGRGANMAMFMSDLKAVNGFDSEMVGYGFEDTDLIGRLVNLGLKRKWAKFKAIEFHLHHEEKGFESQNKPLLKQNKGKIRCENGIEKI